MSRLLARIVPGIALAAAGLAWALVPVAGQGSGQPSTSRGEWPHYTADVRGTRYSPLDQVTAANFNKLEVAWRFKTDSLGPYPEYKLEGTPLMVNGVIYTTGGTRRAVVALDAGAPHGRERWPPCASPEPISRTPCRRRPTGQGATPPSVVACA